MVRPFLALPGTRFPELIHPGKVDDLIISGRLFIDGQSEAISSKGVRPAGLVASPRVDQEHSAIFISAAEFGVLPTRKCLQGNENGAQLLEGMGISGWYVARLLADVRPAGQRTVIATALFGAIKAFERDCDGQAGLDIMMEWITRMLKLNQSERVHWAGDMIRNDEFLFI